MTHSKTWGMLVADDGTLDTVIQCDACHAEYRYNFDPDMSDTATYEDFVRWASADAFEQHDTDIQS